MDTHDNPGNGEPFAGMLFACHNAPVPLHLLDTQGVIIAVSDYWLELLGYGADQVIGHAIMDFYEPGQEHSSRSNLELARNATQGAVMRNVARRMICADGRVVDVLVSATPRHDADGTICAFLGALVDVSAHEQSLRELRAGQAVMLEQQKMESLGRLTGGVAHDFNNMLAVMTCGLEALKMRMGDATPDQHRLVDSCLEAAFRSARLTSQLLSFARHQTLNPCALDVVEVIDDMRVLLVRALGEEVCLDLPSPHADPQAWRCQADRAQLESALLNLVLNARDAINAQGRTPGPDGIKGHIRLEVEQVGDISAQGGHGCLYVLVHVLDDGAGMSESTRLHAMEPFYTTKPRGQGTGLGLSQVHGFARQSGGTLSIASQQGHGTRVSLGLPRAAPGVLQAPLQATLQATLQAPLQEHEPLVVETLQSGQAALSGQGMQPGLILLVEDEPAILLVAQENLADLGYKVQACTNARQAMALLDAGLKPWLLMTDMHMPGGPCGLELALHARQLLPGLHVVLVSGDDVTLDARASRLPGMACLAKPYRAAEMAAVVAHVPGLTSRAQGPAGTTQA